jgi:hypothetical protein
MKSIFTSILIYFLFQASIGFAQDLYPKEELEALKNSLAANAKLGALDSQSLEDFALELLDSGFSYSTIENSLTRFLQNGDLPFTQRSPSPSHFRNTPFTPC